MPAPIVTPDTRDRPGLYATLRNALLGFRYDDGRKGLAALGCPAERVYVRQVTDTPVYPYIALLLATDSLGEYNGMRERGTLEVQVIGRSERQAALVEQLASVCDAAMLGYKEPGSGLIFSRSRRRSTLPPFMSPADKEVVGVLCVYDVVIWPRALTDLRQT